MLEWNSNETIIQTHLSGNQRLSGSRICSCVCSCSYHRIDVSMNTDVIIMIVFVVTVINAALIGKWATK
jgi:hypothetical protein